MMRQALEEGGLRISEEIDLSDAILASLREMRLVPSAATTAQRGSRDHG